MTTYVASKFDSENDPDKPVIGTVVEVDSTKFKIEKVSFALTSEIVKDVMNNVPDDSPESLMNKKGYDECFSKSHTTRPGVQWLIWANKVNE